MNKVKEYFRYIYKMRYFWAYLARCDLIARYRRSKLGMLWIVVSPLLLTMIMAAVLGTVFRIPIAEYAPYILIGMIMWELMTASMVSGGGVFMGAYPYIRQFNHPVTIYSLKSAVVYTVNFLIASIGPFIWICFTAPQNLIISVITMPLTTLLLFILSWAATTIAAFINAKYRDYPQMMSLAMQALWYMSPVFFQEEMFSGNRYLRLLFRLNPVTHLLYLQRKPFLYGTVPDAEDYLFALGSIAVLGIIALLINKKYAKTIIFYL